jgi:hypothetical protein
MKKRKASLSATLVLLIVIITIATYLTKWVFDRYTTATRFYRSSISTVETEGVMLNKVSCCPSGTGCKTEVSSKTVTIDPLQLKCSTSDYQPTAQEIKFTINED